LTSRAEARGDLETASSLDNLPATAEAVAQGEVSMKEAAEVARGEADRPGSEEDLVRLAKDKGLGVLKEEVRKRGLEDQAATGLAARQHRARYFRHWRDELGLVRFAGALPPTLGIGIVKRIEAEAGRRRRDAGPAGRRAGTASTPTPPTPWSRCCRARAAGPAPGPTWWSWPTWPPTAGAMPMPASIATSWAAGR